MKKVEFELNGQRLYGATATVGSTTWFSLGGEVWTVETETRLNRGKSSAAASDPSQVRAPMPGKIIKVFVKVNDVVKNGDVLVVMEAMKMEYTLKATVDGQIESIACNVGEQVVLGATLVKLK